MRDPQRSMAAALLAIAVGSTARGEPLPIAPFAAHYTAEWKTITVGTSEIVLKADGPGRYLYSWTMTARGIFRLAYRDDVIQRSWLSVQGDHVRPDRYRADQGDSSVEVGFDWNGGRARGTAQTKPVDLAITEGTQDIMSIQIEVMLDLKNGNLPKIFRILDKDEIKDFAYTLEGPARIRTAMGVLDTVVVASQRPGNSRILRMWFAPSMGFVPVQAERYRDGKVEFAMRVKTVSR